MYACLLISCRVDVCSEIPVSDFHPRLLKLISDLTMLKYPVDDLSIVELAVQVLQRLMTGQ
jgi:hypothetical protein